MENPRVAPESQVSKSRFSARELIISMIDKNLAQRHYRLVDKLTSPSVLPEGTRTKANGDKATITHFQDGTSVNLWKDSHFRQSSTNWTIGVVRDDWNGNFIGVYASRVEYFDNGRGIETQFSSFVSPEQNTIPLSTIVSTLRLARSLPNQ